MIEVWKHSRQYLVFRIDSFWGSDLHLWHLSAIIWRVVMKKSKLKRQGHWMLKTKDLDWKCMAVID
jgi:hypothetical protein